MVFWTEQNSLSAADIAAQGKTDRFARKWRNTTVAALLDMVELKPPVVPVVSSYLK